MKHAIPVVTVLLVGCLIMGAAAGPAPDTAPSKTVLAEELVDLMNVEESIRNGLEMSRKAMMAQLEQASARFAGNINFEKTREVRQQIMSLIEREMAWEKIKGEFVALYANLFSEEELTGLIEFYKSPVGEAFVRKQRELMQRSLALHQRLMANLQPQIQQIIREAQKVAASPDKEE
ncbi:MAG: DUF2059 domain-containing protein [Kiritimatiellae bacterium]|nr:DUF2059 domain-containing protein [Kiritimatiellia bacterium]MDW8458413.1 DUF2059 domain-containing protein [Verrucomicrobiota bacterium]